MTVFHSTNRADRVEDLTAGVFARARAAGIGYGSEGSEPSVVPRAADKAKSSVRHSLEVSPPARSHQRIRLAPSPRVATLVAGFLLVLAVLIVGWQVFSTPSSEPIAGTVDHSGEMGSALKAADSSGGSGSMSGEVSKTKGGDSPRVSPGTAPELFLPGANGSEIVVYVSGQVAKPGIVHLGDPARVADALEAAGGANPGADLQALNLARLVADGEQIHVPLPGEPLPAGVGAGIGAGSGNAGSTGGGTNAGSNLVNLNTADATALQTLSGIGPALAERIIDYRNTNGKFQSVDQLDEISGIGPALMERLRSHVTV
ncbi:MAG: helix-hairpin-helix domain-containing protein [Mobiluncus porci]|uniref:Helix-hairpin-helix DNA-binding motif class 1 domain-containing protein n=1 Tax=Mobiluncus porci TaxID=2652278 RepID=A0A7K0K166_9ACTO|nr:helix-hairpin-helix domain-containing protein [Mobiluncus porci]MDD7541285.1 helix-hairpin-helix domain-containing protein [Mobiluncus porci]MDY5748128.1 helix-hairpin-helix domain-containing protein [Mobiluncus porci]MST49236.1 hypothetical protein [Mobiluncus porci]